MLNLRKYIKYLLQKSVYFNLHKNMSSFFPKILALILTFNVAQAFVQIVPQFDASSIGPNVIIHDAIMINSSQNLIISYTQDGYQFICRYKVQAGGLVLQTMIQTSFYNPPLGDLPITVICTDALESQLMVFTGISYKLYRLNIQTLGLISSSSSIYNITQMIWSSLNNNIYVVCQNGIFGYLNSNNNWNINIVYTYPSGSCRMSICQNFTFLAVSSVMVQLIDIYDIFSNILIISLSTGELNTIAHEWYGSDVFYYMPPTKGKIYQYNLTSTWLFQRLIFPIGTQNIFSIHWHKVNNISDQFIFGSKSGLTLKFIQYDYVSLTVGNKKKVNYTESLVQIKYSANAPQKAILIFNTFIDSINILEQCQMVGYVFDPILKQCILNVTNTIQINAPNNFSTTSLSVQQQELLTKVISVTASNILIKSCNYLPGNRRILQPIFVFFSNFDDIQLYIYHQRQYDFVLDNLYSAVQTLQSQKWSLIKFEELWGFIGFNTTFVKENFNTKFNYTSWKFIEVQGYSSGFMINTLNLFLSNILLVFLMFVVLRTVFFLLFKYQISKILRQYSFWPYLYFLMIDGNLQFLSYMYLCELQHFFSSNFSNKCGLVFMICIFLVLILLISCSHLLLRQTYGLLAKYFFEDTKTSLQASIYLILQFGYRNFLLGAVHALFNQNYLLKISLLLSVQICFMIYGLFFLKKRNFFSNETRITVNIIAALLRICMIFTFIINTQEQKQILEMTSLSIILEKVHFIIVVIYLLIGTFSTGFQLSKIMYEFLSFIRDKQEKTKEPQYICNSQLENTHITFKQGRLKKLSCIFLQLYVNQNQTTDHQKNQSTKRFIKGNNLKKFKLKQQFTNSLKIKQLKQPQTNKQVQHTTFIK